MVWEYGGKFRFENGLIKETIAECTAELEWKISCANLTRSFLPDKTVTADNGGKYLIKYADVSPLSVYLSIIGPITGFVGSIKPVVHMKDGTEYVMEFSNADGFFGHYTYRRTEADGTQIGEHGFGMFFDTITDVSQIESITVKDVVIPISGETGVSVPIVSDWAKADVKTAAEKEYIPSDWDVYDYTKSITRNQFCNLAYNVLWANGFAVTDDSAAQFADIQSRGYIEAMYSAGLINGKSENIFAPDDTLKREEAAAILYRIAQYTKRQLDKKSDTVYADGAEISGWAKDAVSALSGAGIMRGADGRFSPTEVYTVEQAIVSVLRLMNN